jgi:predicted metalloprotease
MRWRNREGSQNVEDRRHLGGKPMMIGGGLGTLVLVVIVLLLGGNPMQLLNNLPQQGQPGQPGAPAGKADPAEEELKEFVSVVLRDTEKVWEQLFRAERQSYEAPTLVLFKGRVDSACGTASSAVGPFYCPADGKVYLDLVFFAEMKQRFSAPGDFAQAYVVAHEVGHHVQKLLGISDRVHAAQQGVSKREANDLSVRLELQADFFAGVWAHHAEQQFQILEQGDVEEALNAASAIGDDTLQRQSQGHVVPDSFTHGSSAQRVRWFRKGLASGDMSQGNTFDVAQP